MPLHEVTIREIPRDRGSSTFRWSCTCGEHTSDKGALGSPAGSIVESIEHIGGDNAFVITRPSVGGA